MLTIKAAQKKMLEAGLERRYLERVRDRLLDRYDDVVGDLTPEALDAGIERAYRRARSHGLQQDRSITAFISLAFVVSPEFDTHPTTAKFLRAPPDALADLGFEILLRMMKPPDWQRVSDDLGGAPSTHVELLNGGTDGEAEEEEEEEEEGEGEGGAAGAA